MAKRGSMGGYAVVVLGPNRDVVDECTNLHQADVGPALHELQERYGSTARYVTNARDQFTRRREPDRGPALPEDEDVDDDDEDASPQEVGVSAGIQLLHRMMWQNFRQTAQAQVWLMGQAQSFTQQLVEGNRRLAEHANALQRHYQDRLAEIDYSVREQRLMEHDESARRYSQHIIEKAAAETAASRPGRGGEVWDDLIDGVTAAIECWARLHGGDRRP